MLIAAVANDACVCVEEVDILDESDLDEAPTVVRGLLL